MMIRGNRFNIYFAFVLGLGLVSGCRTAESKREKQISVLHLHIEANPDPTKHTEQVFIGREHLASINAQKEPFLTEANIKEAKVIDVMGGFAISLQLDRQGSWLLEEYTGANPAKHLAIFCQWAMSPEEKVNEGRWLAAPKITKRITDGSLIFTPDATREEAEQIVLGIDNVARQIDKEVTNRW